MALNSRRLVLNHLIMGGPFSSLDIRPNAGPETTSYQDRSLRKQEPTPETTTLSPLSEGLYTGFPLHNPMRQGSRLRKRSFFGHDPAENCLHRDEARIVSLSDVCQQLEPQIIVGPLDEFMDGTGNELSRAHRQRRRPVSDALADCRVECCHHSGRHVWPVKLGNEVAKHCFIPIGRSFARIGSG